jgi:hypothetical protein
MRAWRDYWRAPFSREGHKKIIWGLGLCVDLLPPIGWLLGVGYRLRFLRQPPTAHTFPAISPLAPLLQDGIKTGCLILIYTAPGLFLFFLWWMRHSYWLLPALVLFSAGLFWMPAAMIRVIQQDSFVAGLEARKIYEMVTEKRAAYLFAWRVSLSAIVVSLCFLPLGYILFGPATIWAWLVIGEVFEDAVSLS